MAKKRRKASGRHTPPGTRDRQVHPRRDRASFPPGTPVTIAVVDQEVCTYGRETWPTSWTWDDPDVYLREIEALAGELARQGAAPYYVFIDPVEYVEWCREQGRPVDSSESRSLFAGALLTDSDAVPYDPEQPLYPMGITSMVLRSELGEDVSGETSTELVDEIVDPFTDWIVAAQGRFTTTVTASRFRDHDEAEMWQHFRGAITAQATLTYCDDYLSVRGRAGHSGNKIELVNHGDHDPVEAIAALAEAGHGLIGVEHRDASGGTTFRAWEISATGGIRAVPVADLAVRLGTPGAASLRCGWPASP